MTTRSVLSSVLIAAAGALIVALSQPAAADTAPAGEALYCVYNPPTYVGSTQVLPAGRYCVPGP